MRALKLALPISFCALIVSSFTASPAAAAYKSVLITGVPHIKQKTDFCGEACAAMYLNKLGVDVDQDYVFDQSGLDPTRARGCFTKELSTALSRIGFEIGPVFAGVRTTNATAEMEAQFAALHADLAAGIPSIVCMHYNDQPNTTEHFRLVLGYDAEADEIIYHEPAVENAAHRHMDRRDFIKLWPLKYDADRWTVIRLRLEPGKLQKGTASATATDADYCQHIMGLKRKLPHSGFNIVLQKPFVVVGDESADVVRRRAEGTVDWAVQRLKKLYFSRDPNYIIDVWLFKDKTSYDRYTKTLFGDNPGTPFGYFSYQHRALIMNIGTGGGTLVHEIVHPFIASNFPNCPSWFNEGLASLYEQSGEEGGDIHGYVNWRLAGLQDAVKRDRLGTFSDLCGTSTSEFYADNRGTNYAQARYLCYYLQEKGLLAKYYHEFRKNSATDPTGYKTLQQLLGTRDMTAWQNDWEKWVLTLRY